MVNFDSPLGSNANITLERLNDNEIKRVNFNEIINNPVGKAPNTSFDENFVNIIDSVFVEELRFWGSGARWGNVFPVVHLNIQGLNSSFDYIQLLCRDSCPAIIGLCETFLNENNQVLLDIPGYMSIFLNLKVGKKGGLGFYIKNNFQAGFSGFYIPINAKKKVIIGEVYRSPSGSVIKFLETLDDVLRKVLAEKYEVILMGDFILDLTK